MSCCCTTVIGHATSTSAVKQCHVTQNVSYSGFLEKLQSWQTNLTTNGDIITNAVDKAESSIHLVGTASGDEDSLPNVLLKVPGLHTILLLQLLQVPAAQEECLH